MHQASDLIGLIRRIGITHQLSPDKAGAVHAAEIMRMEIPDEAKSLVSSFWFQQYGQIDGTEFFDISSVIKESRSNDIRAKQFIPIGKSGNGDLLVIHWKAAVDTPVGYLRFADYIHPEKEMAECFYQISPSLDAFFSEICDGYEIPCDSYACKAPRKKIPWWHFWVSR